MTVGSLDGNEANVSKRMKPAKQRPTEGFRHFIGKHENTVVTADRQSLCQVAFQVLGEDDSLFHKQHGTGVKRAEVL